MKKKNKGKWKGEFKKCCRPPRNPKACCQKEKNYSLGYRNKGFSFYSSLPLFSPSFFSLLSSPLLSFFSLLCVSCCFDLTPLFFFVSKKQSSLGFTGLKGDPFYLMVEGDGDLLVIDGYSLPNNFCENATEIYPGVFFFFFFLFFSSTFSLLFSYFLFSFSFSFFFFSFSNFSLFLLFFDRTKYILCF